MTTLLSPSMYARMLPRKSGSVTMPCQPLVYPNTQTLCNSGTFSETNVASVLSSPMAKSAARTADALTNSCTFFTGELWAACAATDSFLCMPLKTFKGPSTPELKPRSATTLDAEVCNGDAECRSSSATLGSRDGVFSIFRQSNGHDVHDVCNTRPWPPCAVWGFVPCLLLLLLIWRWQRLWQTLPSSRLISLPHDDEPDPPARAASSRA